MGFIEFGNFSAIISPDFFFLSLLFLVLLLWDPNPYIGSVDIVPQFTDVHFFKLKNSFLAVLGLPCGTQAQ